ncbi:MAG: hypothetical protein JSV61_04790 [Anaerolineales bacterium]|nr:MAG: hypothetical protein JSV61_04790 [Anaerolineales bacterium]
MTIKNVPSSIIWLLLTLFVIAVVTMFGPAESSLGTNVRVVYLHGAWVWTALVAFAGAGIAGLAGLILKKDAYQHWSQSLGYTGLLFWITYLPISMWAMQTNWNGLYLAEPRFRLAVIFSVSGLLLQVGLALLDKPAWTSLANLIFVAALMVALQNTSNVMHPPSPILESDSWRIQLFFLGLLGLTLLAAWHTMRWFYQINGHGRHALEIRG